MRIGKTGKHLYSFIYRDKSNKPSEIFVRANSKKQAIKRFRKYKKTLVITKIKKEW